MGYWGRCYRCRDRRPSSCGLRPSTSARSGPPRPPPRDPCQRAPPAPARGRNQAPGAARPKREASASPDSPPAAPQHEEQCGGERERDQPAPGRLAMKATVVGASRGVVQPPVVEDLDGSGGKNRRGVALRTVRVEGDDGDVVAVTIGEAGDGGA